MKKTRENWKVVGMMGNMEIDESRCLCKMLKNGKLISEVMNDGMKKTAPCDLKC